MEVNEELAAGPKRRSGELTFCGSFHLVARLCDGLAVVVVDNVVLVVAVDINLSCC